METLHELPYKEDKNAGRLFFSSSGEKDNDKTQEDDSCEMKVNDRLYKTYSTIYKDYGKEHRL